MSPTKLVIQTNTYIFRNILFFINDWLVFDLYIKIKQPNKENREIKHKANVIFINKLTP